MLGPARQKLKVLGQFQGTLSNGHTSTTQSIYVIRGLMNCLLGLPAIVALQLLQRVDSVVEEALAIQSRYKAVFIGLGTIGDQYQILLKEGAKAHTLHTPRHVPIPLRNKVREELNRMEAMGVISKIDEPTEWCVGMVIVPKKSGAVRICVDLKPLNESVLQAVHPIPKVEETLALLSGAAVFSKLDANSGFWQILLAPESRPLTTFITPSGRYCFNKLPFGISSAPELFQKRMKKILEGLEGTVCHVDDILVFGDTQFEHDTRLEQVLKKLEQEGVTLNPEKCFLTSSQSSSLDTLLMAPASELIQTKFQQYRACLPHSVFQTFADSWGWSTISVSFLHVSLS